MNGPRVLYRILVIVTVVVLVLAAIPILASDLFREPYSPVWNVINQAMASLHYTYNPSGGGAPPQFPPWRDPADDFLYYQDVKLTTADGLHLAAWFVPAATYQTDAAVQVASVVLCHGLYDSKWTMLRLVPWLHAAGYNVFLFDFRGQGDSQKSPTTIGRKEVYDVQAALDWLEAHGAGDQVAGLGMSLGAAALVDTAAQDNRLHALILDSLFAVWNDVNYAEGYRLPPDWLVPGVPNPVDVISKVHVPVFFIHGTADILVHVDHAYRLFNAANDPKWLWINDSGHAWSAWTYPLRYQAMVLEFLEMAFSSQEA
jgi:pimeloyl-ACP methyl ester carboxylesterase